MKQDIHKLASWLEEVCQEGIAIEHKLLEWKMSESVRERKPSLGELQHEANRFEFRKSLSEEDVRLMEFGEGIAAAGRERIRFERWLEQQVKVGVTDSDAASESA